VFATLAFEDQLTEKSDRFANDNNSLAAEVQFLKKELMDTKQMLVLTLSKLGGTERDFGGLKEAFESFIN